MTEKPKLPVPVFDFPYWRVLLRPSVHQPELIGSIRSCLDIPINHAVRKRGWPFPRARHDAQKQETGENWISEWTDFGGHIEYWRFFQSGQFVFLQAVREVVDTAWAAKLQNDSLMHFRQLTDEQIASVPGFISMVNLLYNVTEYFTFASRLCLAGIYSSPLDISVELHGVSGFVLTTEPMRIWTIDRVCNCPKIINNNRYDIEDLATNSPELARNCAAWIMERLGWLGANPDVLKKDQEEFLSGLV